METVGEEHLALQCKHEDPHMFKDARTYLLLKLTQRHEMVRCQTLISGSVCVSLLSLCFGTGDPRLERVEVCAVSEWGLTGFIINFFKLIDSERRIDGFGVSLMLQVVKLIATAN